MEVAIFWIVVVVIIAAAAYASYYFKKKRREALAFAAKQLGLEYSPADIYGLVALPFQLFTRGDGRGCENVLSGDWQALPLREFDFWYYDESTDSDGNTSKTYYHFSCAWTRIEAFCSPIAIGRESMFSRLADHMGFQDIQFETEEFNNAFNVKSQDRKFASDLIDQRMMGWLLQAGEPWSFEVAGQDLLVFCKRLKPTELIPLIGTLKGFTEHIPRVVYSLYGAPQQVSPQAGMPPPPPPAPGLY